MKGYVYQRGNMFYVGFFDRAGKEIQRSTNIRVGEPDAEKRAKKALRLIEERIAAEAAVLTGKGDGPLTVAVWAKSWIERRKSADIATWNDDDGRLRLHVVPTLGAMKLDEVRPRHIVELIRTLKTKPCQRDGSPLAPRTVRHVYTTLRAFFRDAITDELIDRNPLDGVNPREVLPAKIDKDPEWRLSAHFSAAEVITLVTDERIPWDRRAFYAVMFLAGLRFGEVSALSWRHYDPSKLPLGRLVVAGSYNTRRKKIGLTKTQTTRLHPVPPPLAAFLKVWREKGWPLFFGREPGANDLIVPSRTGRPRSNNHMKNKFDEDLARVGLRKRRQHDARKTWLTQLVADGANKDILERITHARPQDVMSGYIELEWPTLCAEVAKWSMLLPKSDDAALPSALPRAPTTSAPSGDAAHATAALTEPPPAAARTPRDDVDVEPRAAAHLQFTYSQKNPPISRGIGWRSGRDSNPRPPA